MQVENMVAEQALCRPFTVSHFEIEHAVVSNGIYADIRRFRWEEPCDARLDVDAYYIDYALSPRATQTQIGRAHVCTPVPHAHIVCRPLLAKKHKIITH